ncbi:hypothetical protein GO013_13245 [Pseudodesulfovibrio sp. JC047]|uniref:hypothetical protein n=1 Tax=Pseudodesulfovibrio sp. JC047 TaxID=2683199 RepID=UPI0013D069D2|nr:hypothetical protein [Pseudodesulfovibrio sp. JC047]NDV20376.1 hypothetical protein [Pseudodesulfovibrio sp. JC047]
MKALPTRKITGDEELVEFENLPNHQACLLAFMIKLGWQIVTDGSDSNEFGELYFRIRGLEKYPGTWRVCIREHSLGDLLPHHFSSPIECKINGAGTSTYNSLDDFLIKAFHSHLLEQAAKQVLWEKNVVAAALEDIGYCAPAYKRNENLIDKSISYSRLFLRDAVHVTSGFYSFDQSCQVGYYSQDDSLIYYKGNVESVTIRQLILERLLDNPAPTQGQHEAWLRTIVSLVGEDFDLETLPESYLDINQRSYLNIEYSKVFSDRLEEALKHLPDAPTMVKNEKEMAWTFCHVAQRSERINSANINAYVMIHNKRGSKKVYGFVSGKEPNGLPAPEIIAHHAQFEDFQLDSNSDNYEFICLGLAKDLPNID